MSMDGRAPVLLAEGDSGEGLLFIVVIVGIALLVATFQEPKKMYWIGLVALQFQALFFVFQLPKIVVLAKQNEPPPQTRQQEPGQRKPEEQQKPGRQDFWTDGQKAALLVATLPFLLPLAAAYLTGAVAGNPMVGVASFTLWSLVQVVVHGQLSDQEKVMERVGKAIKFAIPVVALLINLMRAFSAGQGL